MSILLKEITRDNFSECINLKTAEGQERFVAPNVRSIAESKVEPYLVPLAVYQNDKMVGFTLYGRDPEDGSYHIVRLMIDAKYQGKGFAKEAMRELIKQLKEMPDCREVFLSYVPGNLAAERLYLGLGFQKTGKVDEDGEIIMRFSFVDEKENI
jgi:diamine N-acetyltransferase